MDLEYHCLFMPGFVPGLARLINLGSIGPAIWCGKLSVKSISVTEKHCFSQSSWTQSKGYQIHFYDILHERSWKDNHMPFLLSISETKDEKGGAGTQVQSSTPQGNYLRALKAILTSTLLLPYHNPKNNLL